MAVALSTDSHHPNGAGYLYLHHIHLSSGPSSNSTPTYLPDPFIHPHPDYFSPPIPRRPGSPHPSHHSSRSKWPLHCCFISVQSLYTPVQLPQPGPSLLHARSWSPTWNHPHLPDTYPAFSGPDTGSLSNSCLYLNYSDRYIYPDVSDFKVLYQVCLWDLSPVGAHPSR